MAACTNPDVVRTLVELSLGAGAKKVTVMDNTTNQAQRCYVRSGIQAAAKAAGADVPFVNPRRIKKMSIGGAWLKDWDVIQDFVECDTLINVPIAKHHNLCRVTLGMKNWLGAIGDPRNRLHQKIDEASADLAAFFKPKLTVLDAYRILVRNGPAGRPAVGHEAPEDRRGRRGRGRRGSHGRDVLRHRSGRTSACSNSPWSGSSAGSTWRNSSLKNERSRKHRRLQLLRIAVQAFFLGLVFLPAVRDAFHRRGLHRPGRGVLSFRSRSWP